MPRIDRFRGKGVGGRYLIFLGMTYIFKQPRHRVYVGNVVLSDDNNNTRDGRDRTKYVYLKPMLLNKRTKRCANNTGENSNLTKTKLFFSRRC